MKLAYWLARLYCEKRTVKPVLRGHPRKGQKWLLKTGDPLIQADLHYFWFKGPRKGGCLRQVIP